MSLAIRGNDFNFFFTINKTKIELVNRKWTQKSTLFARLTPVFGRFGVRKSRFLDFFKVVMELFRKSWGIVFDLNMPTFGCTFNTKG